MKKVLLVLGFLALAPVAKAEQLTCRAEYEEKSSILFEAHLSNYLREISNIDAVFVGDNNFKLFFRMIPMSFDVEKEKRVALVARWNTFSFTINASYDQLMGTYDGSMVSHDDDKAGDETYPVSCRLQ